MNKIYKVIFNRNKNRYEIVSELASSRGGKCKVKAGKQIAKLFMTGLLATFLSSVALAAEQEVVVKYDDATGTIKIVKKEDESQVLASYAVGGNISSIDPNEGTYPTGTISLGKDSKVLQNNTIAIGTDAHAGDASGSVTQSDGKIAIGNKTVASGDRSIALGNQSTTNKGSYNIVQGNDSIGIGTSTSVFGYSGVSIGRRNIIGVPDPDLVNNRVLTTKSKTPDKKGVDKEAAPGGNSVIVGAYNVAYGNRSSIVGTYSRAMGSNSVAIGSGVQSLSDGSIAIGKGSGYEFEDGSRFKNGEDVTGDYYGRDWELPPEYKVLKQVLSNDINGDKPYKQSSSGRKGKYKYEKGGSLPKYNNYGAGSSDPGGFIVEGKNALGIGTYTQVRGDSAIGLATGEMTADLSDKDKSAYARDMRKIMDMEETLYDAKEALQAGTGDTETLKSAVKAAEERLATAKKNFRETYLKKYSFIDGDGALGVGRQILAQGDRSMAVGDYAKAISSDAISYGGQTLANGTNSMAMGGNAHVGTIDTSFDNSMAIGSHTNVQAGNAVALGAFSQVTGENSLALGFGKQSGGAITYNSVSGKDSTLIGSYGTVKGNNSILIGSNGNIANDRVVGLGNNINIEAADQNDQENNTAGSVFLGDHAGYVKDSKRSRSLGQVDVVGSAGKMELTESLSSTKGALRDYTKDFIYIYMLERQDDGTQIGAPIAVRSNFAGGDSTVGVVSVGSTYEQQFNSLKDIQDYHTKVGSLITVPVDVTVQVTKNGVPLGKQQQTRYFAADSTRDTIYADNTLSEEDKAKVWDTIQKSISSSNSKYTVFETRRIQNVAPGLIGLNSTDAINGSQLFATNQMLGNLVGSLKKTLGDSVTVTEDGQITVAGDINTLGWIAKAGTVGGSNGTVAYDADKKTDETEEAYQARIAKLKKDGYIVDASKVMTFKAGKNIGLVQKPGEFSISTIDTPSFTSVTTGSGDNTTVMNQDGVTIKAKTDNTDGTKTDHKTSITKDGLATDGTVKVTNGKTGDDAKDLVTIDKGTDGSGTDKEYGKIGLDGKNGSNATITVDRGTSSLDDTKNIGTDPNQDISKDNPAKMDRITYTTKNKDGKDVITHEVATMDDGLFFSGDSADGKEYNGATNTKNTFGRKLSEEAKIVGGVTTPANLTDNNIGVVSNGSDTLTIKLAKQLTGLDSATYTSPTTKADDGDATSTMKVDGNGIRFVGDNNAVKTDAPSLTTDGIDGGNKQITNVGSGLKDGNTDISISDLKDPNKVPPTSPVLNNAVNVGDLKNIIDTGFKLNTSGQATKPGASTVKIGDTINIIDGANTKVSAIDDTVNGTHTFHIDVNGLPMSYVDSDGNPLTKIGDKFYKTSDLVNGVPPAGTDEVPANKVTSNVSMLDNTGSHTGVAPQIKNVGSGLVDNNGKTIKPNELLNITDTNNPVLKNAVNVGDLKQVAAAAKTEVTGTGEAFVTRKQATDGHTIYNVHVDKILSHKDANGNELVRGGDGKYYTNEEIKDKTYIPSENKWYSNSDLTNGKPNQGAQAVTPAPVDQSNVKTSLVNPNAGVGTGTDTSMTLDNVKSGIGGDAGNGIKDGTTVDGTAGNNTFIKKLEKVGGTGEGAIDKTTVVNAGDLKNLADTPLFFSGDAADGKEYNGAKNTKNTFGRKLSEEAKIVGGVTAPANLTDNNIGVVSNGSDTLTIKLAKQLIGLDSATYTSPTTKADDGNVTSTMKVDGNGIRFVGDNNAVKTDAPSLTTDGITGGNKQITNVGSGLKDGNTTISISDLDDPEKVPNTSSIWNNAVNVGDLKKAKDAATTEITGTGKAIVTKTVGNKGQNIYNVHVDPVVDVVATDGKTQVVRGDDGKYYNPTDIADKTFVSDGKGGGSWYNKSDIGANGKPNTGAPVQNISPVDVKNNFVNPNGTGSIVLDNVKSGIGGEVKNAAGNNTFIENINKVGKKNDDGTAAPDAISENTVVNAKDLKNVVDTGFKLNTSGQGTNPADTVKVGDTIQVVDGKNTTVSAITNPSTGVHEFHIDVTGLPVTYTATEGENGQPVDVSKVGNTYQLADGTKLVNYGDKFYKPNQIVNGQPVGDAQGFTINDDIRLVNPNNGTGPVKITNVAPGVGDTDAVNMSQLKTSSAGSKTEVTGTGAAEVTKKTAKDGHDIYNVHVDKLLTVKPVTPGTAMERGADGKYYAPSEIQDKTFVSDGNGGGSWYNASDVDAKTGKPLEGKSALADQPKALDQSKLKNSVVNPNGDGATIVDNVKSAIDGVVGNGAPNGSTINGEGGTNTFIKNLDKVGKPANEGGIDKTTVVNAGDLKNLADTPLFFSGDAADGKNGNVKNTFGRKLSEEAKIVGGVDLGLQAGATAEARKKAIADKLTNGNIGVISDGTDTLTIKLAKDLTGLNSSVYTSLTPAGNDGDATSSMKLDGNGIRFIDGQGKAKTDAPSLTTDGIKGGNKQITNIGSGLRDRQGKPVTLKNASEDILNNAVNVRDLRDVVQGLTDSGKGGGFGLTGNNGEVHKSLGETITLKGGIANKIENGIDMNKPEKATTDKNTYIDVKTSKNGSEKIMVVEIAKDLTDLNSAEFTDQEGNTTKMKGDGIYIDKNGDGNADISLTSEGLNNGGNKITNVADGTEDTDAVNVSQLNKLKQEIKQNIGDEINELNAYAPVVYSDKDGNRVIRKGNKFVKKNDETVEILPQDIRLSLVNADGKTTNPSTLQNVAKGVNKTDAVNVEQLKEATEKPLTFNGDAGSSSAKLGETVAIKGGANSADLTDNNIGVIANSSTKTLNVKLSKKLKGLESAEFVDNNGNTTNITGDGVHISGGNGSNVSLTSQGLNNGGNRITNVAPGVEATDAVNVSQLNQVGAALHNRINNVAKGAYGGVASAGAMASLPQAYLPGKSMVAAGASHYRGESAVALGASRISDNGKIILKLNASHNTSGNTMVGAGVGYQF
ncbi:YadA-like family protein [Gallibacterium anatis]|uniref:YadA-like family protein n=1 Tax=Gallibacterium anatis TaxID=750 RepID=UPI00300433CA